MRQFIETDFDKIYDALNECYLIESDFIIKNKDIDRYIVPANIAEDNKSIKVRADDALPSVQNGEWPKLTRSNYIEILNCESNKAQNTGKSGIYVIKNDITNQLYFGKASDFKDRLDAHGRARKRDSKFLHAAIDYANNHPKENITFSWGIYALVDPIDLNDKEKQAIADWGTFESEYDYNLTPGGDGGSVITKNFDEVKNRVIELLKTTEWTSEQIAQVIRKEFNYDTYDRTNVDDINKEYQIKPDRVRAAAKARYDRGDTEVLNSPKAVELYYKGTYIDSFDHMADAARYVAKRLNVEYKKIQSSSLLKSSRNYKYNGYQLVVKE